TSPWPACTPTSAPCAWPTAPTRSIATPSPSSNWPSTWMCPARSRCPSPAAAESRPEWARMGSDSISAEMESDPILLPASPPRAGAVRFRRGERRNRPDSLAAAQGEFDVSLGPFALGGDLGRRQLAHHPGRHAGNQRARRHFAADLHEAHGGDDGLLADAGTIHHDGVHPDQRIASDMGGMDHRAMADVAARGHHAVEVRQSMDHAVVLQVGLVLHHDPAEVAAQDRSGADIAARPDDDVADQHGARMYPRRRID